MQHSEQQDQEAHLVIASKSGDLAAFGELVRMHKHRILALATQFCGSAHEADDLGQDIFLKAYQKLHTFRGHSAFSTWLHRIAVNTCLDHLKKAKRSPLCSVPLDRAAATEDHAKRYEMERYVDSLLANLPPKDRLILTMLHMDGAKVDEVAALTGMKQGAVKVRAHRARKRLKRLMERHAKRSEP